MISANAYLKEVSDIFKGSAPEIEAHFIEAYKFYEALMGGSNNNPSPIDIDYLLQQIFKGAHPFFSIPIEFLNSAVGNVLFSIKYGSPKTAFTSKDIRLILGVSRGLIAHDLGKTLIAFKSDRPILVYEDDLLNYMSSKGISTAESKERISTYFSFLSKKASEDEISGAISAVKSKYTSSLKKEISR